MTASRATIRIRWGRMPTTEAGFDAMFAVNVNAAFLLTAAYAP
ncbi:MAG: hypothetical protein WBZ37_10235 [Mycobacterium sp.]